MKMKRQERPLVKVECLKQMARLGLNPAQTRMIAMGKPSKHRCSVVLSQLNNFIAAHLIQNRQIFGLQERCKGEGLGLQEDVDSWQKEHGED
jgi:hypothetical protein